MKPLPQTRQVLTALAASGGSGLEDGLVQVAEQINRLVPSCVGVSISLADAELTLTFVATSDRALVLDAVQGAHGGPCVASPLIEEEVSVPEILDETRWQEYAASAAAEGVRSSLSLPLLDTAGAVTAAVNVYAAEPHAFDQVLDVLRQAVGPLAGQVTTNADLSFRTRDRAESTPRRLEERSTIATAVGCLVALHGVGPEGAQALLEAQAQAEGVPLVVAARSVLDRVADWRPA